MTAVIDMLKNGWALVPVPQGLKGPKTVNWNHQEKCVKDPSDANMLSDMNIGLAHAYCTPTPTCAIDIDDYRYAKKWLSSHRIDLAEMLHAHDASVIWSGKRFSLKLLYRLPVGTNPLESKKIVGIDGKSAIEFRCASKDGKTVQDILPPSLHPEGHCYQWVGKGDPIQLPNIPQALLDLWVLLIGNGSRVALRKSNVLTSGNRRPETPRQIAIIESALGYIDADCSYEKWRNVLWAVLSTGWKCAEDLAYKWSVTAPSRFKEDSFWLVVNSYIPDHPNPITLGTIYHHARVGGWNER